MFNLILMILIAVGASGSAIYAGYNYFSVSQSVTEQQLTQARLEETASAVTANIIEIDGTFFVPAGVNGTDYMQIPAWISPNARATDNVPFRYCPFSAIQGTGTADTVKLTSGTSYAIQTYSSPITQSRAYVVNSPSPPVNAPDGTLAVLVAPPVNVSTPPSCTSLALDSNGHLALNGAAGTVVAITAGQFFKERVYAAAQSVTLQVSVAGSGDYSGRDTSNQMTLNQAMFFWRAVKPRALTIRLANGNYAADATTFPAIASANINPGKDRDQSLLISGNGPASSTITMSANLPGFGGSVTFNNITLDATGYDWNLEAQDNITLQNIALKLANWNIYDGAVTVDSANMAAAISGNVTIFPSAELRLVTNLALNFSANKSLIVQGKVNAMTGGLTLSGPAASVPLIIQAGGIVYHSGSAIIINSAGSLAEAVDIYPGGTLIASGITVNNSPTNYIIGVMGELTADNNGMSINFPNGTAMAIRMMQGGVIDMEALTIGTSSNRIVTGIYDDGGAMIRLRNTSVIYATSACWGGSATPNLFSSSAAPANGANMTPGAASSTNYLFLDNATTTAVTCNM